MSSECTHQPIIEGGNNPCRHCPPIPTQARMDKIVAVGFGAAQATRDGRMVADGEQGVILTDGVLKRVDEFITFGDIEKFAVVMTYLAHREIPIHLGQ